MGVRRLTVAAISHQKKSKIRYQLTEKDKMLIITVFIFKPLTFSFDGMEVISL